MELFKTISSYIIYFGSGQTMLMAIGQLTGKNLQRINYIAAINLFINSVIILQIGLFADKIPQKYPHAVFFLSTAVYSFGPLNILYYATLLYPDKPVERIKLHLAVPVIILITEIFFLCSPADIKRSIINNLYSTDLLHPSKLMILFGGIHVISYLIYLIREIIPFTNKKEVKIESRIVIGLTILVIICLLLAGHGLLTGMGLTLRIGGLLGVIIHIIVYLIYNRYSEFFFLLKRNIRERRYRNSMLKGIDTDTLYYQLHTLLTEEYLYRESGMTLSKVAELLAVTPHQLSQLLNEKLDVNFSNFVNSYRIEEAKKLLVDEPSLSIISICYHTGFNTKSSFNMTFKKFTGENPKEYRKRHLGSE